MKTDISVLSLAISSFILSFGTSFLAVIWVLGIFAPLPKPAAFPFKLPANVILMPADRVKPGTFRMEISIPEWKLLASKGEAPDKPIVSYGEYLGKYAIWENRVKVNYWLARKDGTFFHAKKVLDPEWRGTVKVGKIAITDDQLIVRPARSFDTIGLFIFFSVIGAFLSLYSINLLLREK